MTARRVLMVVVAFSVIYGCVLIFKLHQEWTETVQDAEASQARTAAFVAERVSGRLSEVRGALGVAVAQIERAASEDMAAAASVRLDALRLSGVIEGAALLPPDDAILSAGSLAVDPREAADAALSAPGGAAALAGDPSRIVLAAPVRLADDRVGALIAIIDPQALLPRWGEDHVVVLADQAGRTLALQPPAPVRGAPLAAERFGLDAERVAEMAERGGALSGARFGGEPRILGAAALPQTGLQTYSLGPAAIDQARWRRTLAFHGLLFLAPFFTAVALFWMLRNQITELNTTQARLRESDRRFRLATEGARCGVWDWDVEEDDVYVTESFARMLGRPHDELLKGPEFLALLRQDDRPRLRAALRAAARGEEIDLEVRGASLPVWLHMRGRPLARGESAAGGRLIGVAIDVTENKGAQARVAAAESRLRAALESMSESFVLWDSRRRLVLWNRKFREFFKLGEDALRSGLPYQQVELAASEAIKQVHDRAEGEDAYELELADGRWLHYSERTTNDGGLVSVGADITALKRQEKALKENDRAMRQTVESLKRSQERIEELAKSYEQEKIRAEEANRSKSEFLANMSHELRTPLNAINGFSEIMAKEMFGPLGHERYVDYVNDILSSGQHLLSLINDILDMSKIEAGKMVLQPEAISPGDLMDQCARIMRARAEEKDITLQVEGEDLPEIEADPRAIKQIILNLMSNAVKFTPEGGRVIVRGYDAVDGVVMQVADTGIGIAEEDLPRLGRPFEQIESQHSKSHQGSGLGLALSKSLVEMHGGTLRIDSVLGKGTTISFTLPVKPPRDISRPRADESADEPAEPAPDLEQALEDLENEGAPEAAADSRLEVADPEDLEADPAPEAEGGPAEDDAEDTSEAGPAPTASEPESGADADDRVTLDRIEAALFGEANAGATFGDGDEAESWRPETREASGKTRSGRRSAGGGDDAA
ncbi:sensor histidine kinase [Marinicauda salina]|uniref:sensor histidine kinase n=1 Tax=Marinicauda salina TaxID=2135793 RepID=UPI001E45C867|nr:PAS domain-containing sensor histidine kinase [Marinicauda salina]